MGYKSLVTIDLRNTSIEQRETFYGVLVEEKWLKIPNLNTAWKIVFNDGATRIGAITSMIDHIKKAKDKSNVQRVDYAIQIDLNDLFINSLT